MPPGWRAGARVRSRCGRSVRPTGGRSRYRDNPLLLAWQRRRRMAVDRHVSGRVRAMLGVGLAAALLGGGTAAAQQSGAATAELRDASGAVVGTATFTQAPSGVQIVGSVRGLTPGQHG